MVNWIVKVFGANWKTNLASAVTFLLSVPSLITAITDWAHHQPADWRGAVLGIVVATGLAFSKDASNHSTAAQVEKATEKAAEGK